MAMTIKRADTDCSGHRCEGELRIDKPRPARTRLGAVVVVLVFSATVFCGLVVLQRDRGIKNAAMASARRIESWLQDYLDEKKYLPSALPDDLLAGMDPPTIPYPALDAIPMLRNHMGVYVLIAGPRQGLIMPDGDGYAAVIFDHNNIHTRWMTESELSAERKKRDDLLEK